jgi:hypothetical protein
VLALSSSIHSVFGIPTCGDGSAMISSITISYLFCDRAEYQNRITGKSKKLDNFMPGKVNRRFKNKMRKKHG